MATERNIVSRELNRLKDKHGLTQKTWADRSGVPIGTISRYLGYNVGVPNFAHICAMLSCIGESVDIFYSAVNGAVQNADVQPAAVPAAPASIDPAQDTQLLRSMRERVAEQGEAMLSYLTEIHEQDAQLREMRVEMRAMDKAAIDREARLAELSADLKAQHRHNRRLLVALLAFAAAVIVLASVYIWDVSNLHKVLTAILNPGLK